jgi:pre-mRNA-splicing helicase BRR2
MSRRWRTRKDVQSVRLVIADELHLIGGANGHVLEVVLSRMRYMGKEMGCLVRVVALAASIANAKDVADWLGVPPRASFHFKPSTRPVPLELTVTGVDVHHFEVYGAWWVL